MRGSSEPAAQPGKRRGVCARVRVAVAKRRVVPGKMTRSYWRRKEVELMEKSTGPFSQIAFKDFFKVNIWALNAPKNS